ncbi:MFS transporter [Brevibacterium atlanticum]|uniref:MFS transporter n=1 Tax=Brevibacterium atlanticum TaxID=2697563 RepID=UPI001D197247|nr:MFS transporter [Brevibacterium atlanticum]
MRGSGPRDDAALAARSGVRRSRPTAGPWLMAASTSLGARRIALLALFFLPGITISSWVTRTPSIRDALGASTAEMGFVLFGLSVGSMIGILGSGPLVSRWGARPVVLAGTIGIIASMPIVGLGAAVAEPFVVAAGLVVFGLGMGTGEVAMNVEGAELEKHLDRPFLPLLHGFFSLGTVIGAVLGILATAADFSVLVHLLAVGLLGMIVFVPAMRHVPVGTGQVPRSRETIPAEAVPQSPSTPVWRDPGLIAIGVIVLGMALAEGTANDWLPLVMVDGHGFAAALGSSVYAIFAAAMTLGRFIGGPIVARFGRPTVLAVSAAFGLVGIGLVSLVDSQFVAAIAVLLWGLGTSLGFPVALSEAGDSGPNPAARVATVSTIGYLAFLVGPPSLGLVGEHWGLRAALLIPMAMIIPVLIIAPLLRRQGRGRKRDPHTRPV